MGHTLCYPMGSRLVTDSIVDPVAGHITDIIRKSICETGFNWKMVPDEKRNVYFNEFKKLYRWDSNDKTIIKNTFMKQAGELYRKMVSNWKKIGKPTCISEEVWQSFKAYWELPDVVKKSKTNRLNRYSEVAGPGTGCSKHICGSRSAIGHAKQLRKERNGEQPDVYEQFLRMHMRKDGTFADQRSRLIHEEVESRIVDDEEAGEEIDKNKIYLEVVGGVKKQRIYGLGSAASSLISTSQSVASTSMQETLSLREDVQRLKNLLEERDAKYEEMQSVFTARVEAERAARQQFEDSFEARMASMFQEALRNGNFPSSQRPPST